MPGFFYFLFHISCFFLPQSQLGNTTVESSLLCDVKIKLGGALSLFSLHWTRNDVPGFGSFAGDSQPPALMIKAAACCCCCADWRCEEAEAEPDLSAGLRSLMIYWHRFREQIWARFIGSGSGRSLDFASQSSVYYSWAAERRFMYEPQRLQRGDECLWVVCMRAFVLYCTESCGFAGIYFDVVVFDTSILMF